MNRNPKGGKRRTMRGGGANGGNAWGWSGRKTQINAWRNPTLQVK